MNELQVVFSKLNSKVAALEWSTDAASGLLEGLDWIDADLNPEHEAFQVVKSQDGKKYRHRPYGYFLPTIMARAAHEAQKNGDPTVLEGMLYAYAKIEWLMATRKYFWSPLSPVPELLSVLAEAYGVGPEIHRNDPQALSRLISKLPFWHKQSGTAEKAKEMLVEIIGRELPLRIKKPEAPDAAQSLHREVFLSREWRWWKNRKEKSSRSSLRISEGMLQFQSEEPEEQFPLLREDVLVHWKEGKPFPTEFLRLLPMWISIRIVIEAGEE